MRLDLDVRRVWKCPACGRETRSEGHVVSKLCGCTRDGVAMQLVERPRPKPAIRMPQPAPEPTADSDIPPLADFPTDIPVNPPRGTGGDSKGTSDEPEWPAPAEPEAGD